MKTQLLYNNFVERAKWKFSKISSVMPKSFLIHTKWKWPMRTSSDKSSQDWSSRKKVKLISDVVMPLVEVNNKNKDQVAHQLRKSLMLLMPSNIKRLHSTWMDSRLISENTWKSYWHISMKRMQEELLDSRPELLPSSSGPKPTSENSPSTPHQTTIPKTFWSCHITKTNKTKPQLSSTLWTD